MQEKEKICLLIRPVELLPVGYIPIKFAVEQKEAASENPVNAPFICGCQTLTQGVMSLVPEQRMTSTLPDSGSAALSVVTMGTSGGIPLQLITNMQNAIPQRREGSLAANLQ